MKNKGNHNEQKPGKRAESHCLSIDDTEPTAPNLAKLVFMDAVGVFRQESFFG